MAGFFPWLESTGIATTVRDSLLLTSTLSAVHLLGFTLITGGAFVSNLRLLGVLLPDRRVLDVSGDAGQERCLAGRTLHSQIILSGGTPS